MIVKSKVNAAIEIIRDRFEPFLQEINDLKLESNEKIVLNLQAERLMQNLTMEFVGVIDELDIEKLKTLSVKAKDQKNSLRMMVLTCAVCLMDIVACFGLISGAQFADNMIIAAGVSTVAAIGLESITRAVIAIINHRKII